jgi:hypothetical protein
MSSILMFLGVNLTRKQVNLQSMQESHGWADHAPLVNGAVKAR